MIPAELGSLSARNSLTPAKTYDVSGDSFSVEGSVDGAAATDGGALADVSQVCAMCNEACIEWKESEGLEELGESRESENWEELEK